MRTFIRLSFITTFLFITVLSVQAALGSEFDSVLYV